MAKLSEGSVRTLEALEKWFKATSDMPYFTIYNGANVRDRLAVNNQISDSEQAWNQLEGYLSEFEDGVFTIYKTDKPGNNTGMKTKYTPGSSIVSPSVNGMPGHAIMGISEYDDRIGSIIEKAVSREKAQWERDREIDELKAMITSKQSITDRVGTMLESSLPQLIEIVIPALVAKFTGTTPQVANITGIQKQESEEEIIPEEDLIVNALQRIEASGIDINNVLPKLADMVEKNPAMIKGFLNNLQ
jgi:hypothetical protein